MIALTKVVLTFMGICCTEGIMSVHLILVYPSWTLWCLRYPNNSCYCFYFIPGWCRQAEGIEQNEYKSGYPLKRWKKCFCNNYIPDSKTVVQKRGIETHIPASVYTYDQLMGDAKQNDQMITLYPIKGKQMRLYCIISIFYCINFV